MKDQYVGDINDYVKYSVLRALGETHTRSMLVCWMLTADDNGRDGGRTSYLRDPERYRAIDPELFDSLGRLVLRGDRSTSAIERLGTLPGATFFRQQLEDAAPERDRFLADLWREAHLHRVVFFDPDNGLSVRSVPRGRAGSRRYVYCPELAPLQNLNTAAIIYQHFPRAPRAPYVAQQLDRLASALPAFSTLAIYSPSVALLAAAPCDQVPEVKAALHLATDLWAGRLCVTAIGPPRA